MDKKEIQKFFDECAPWWDEHITTDRSKISWILDRAGVRENAAVLDVGCGTGVLFPFYIARNVSRVTGVDISPEMIRIASGKAKDERIRLICADAEMLPPSDVCDCCVIYNAFPHFPNRELLIGSLAKWIKPGGRLTVAHGMSLEQLHKHHAGRAERVSLEMLAPQELAACMEPWFCVDTALADEDKYIVSGARRA
ncbi:MAG: class I SAM-dependent methyltransferase [Clostridia bacterium]|nr:class I SAM-dependent methyltransferase [Clostridia bacterium]